MNTDNVSIAGETLDYGPCAFMNTYNPKTVFSSIDINGRYAFDNQSTIGHWNLAVFANTLLPLISNNQEEAIELATDTLDKYSKIFSVNYYEMMYKKLGILQPIEEDKVLVNTLLQLMDTHEADYTNTFAALTLNKVSIDTLFTLDEFQKWREQWEHRTNRTNNRIKTIKLMQTQNPLVIPRNHLVEAALENAIQGDKNKYNQLLNTISKPYDYTSNNANFQTVPDGFDESYKTYCGT